MLSPRSNQVLDALPEITIGHVNKGPNQHGNMDTFKDKAGVLFFLLIRAWPFLRQDAFKPINSDLGVTGYVYGAFVGQGDGERQGLRASRGGNPPLRGAQRSEGWPGHLRRKSKAGGDPPKPSITSVSSLRPAPPTADPLEACLTEPSV